MIHFEKLDSYEHRKQNEDIKKIQLPNNQIQERNQKDVNLYKVYEGLSNFDYDVPLMEEEEFSIMLDKDQLKQYEKLRAAQEKIENSQNQFLIKSIIAPKNTNLEKNKTLDTNNLESPKNIRIQLGPNNVPHFLTESNFTFGNHDNTRSMKDL